MTSKAQRLQQRIEELRQNWETLSKKQFTLEHEKILETRAEEKFRLEEQIEQIKVERQQIERELEDLENQLEKIEERQEEPEKENRTGETKEEGARLEEPLADPAALQEAYLSWLCNQASQVSLAGIDPKAASSGAEACLNLGAIYTALLTFGTEHPERDQFSSREGPGVDKELGRRLSALAQLNQHKRLVLLGDPGSGKSTFVNFVTMCLAGQMLFDQTDNPGVGTPDLDLLTAPLPDDEGKPEEERQPWEHGALLPVRVILRDFAARGLPTASQKAGVKHLWAFLANELAEVRLGAYTPYLEQHLREHGGLLLLDGLDEVPEADKRRTQIKQVVEEFARVFFRCRVVVTSRTYAYQQQDWRLSEFAEAVLAPFTRGQIIRFVDHWYGYIGRLRGMHAHDAQGRAELLKHAIFDSDRLYSFAERPLLLTLMASLHAWRGGSLPEKREELYNDTVELLLDWWESSKVVRDADGRLIIAQESLTALLNVGKEHVHTVLNALAFDAHAHQRDLEGTADISEENLVNALLRLSQNKDLRPIRLIEHLSDRAGLLLPRGVKIYTFPHRTFQEYLAACFLTDQDDYPENVARLVRQDPNRWREVVLLAGAKAARGAASTIWSLVDALCWRELSEEPTPTPSQEGKPGETPGVHEDVWGALLAGQAVVETANLQKVGESNQRKLHRIRHWLAAILTEQVPANEPFPAVERALAGNLLAVLGDPRPGVGLREDGLPEIVWCDVPAGPFLMGSDPKKDEQAYGDEQPQHEVYVSAFRISRYPVTNAQYRAFIEDGGYTEKWRQCWTEEGWTWREKEHITEPRWVGGVFDLDNHPVVRVSWYEVSAFCQWLTIRLREQGELTKDEAIRLPSEAKWEKAARSDDGRFYPWGNAKVTPELANYNDTGLGTTSTVGCFPRGASPYGCDDMAGNVWEWCLDVWHDSHEGTPTDGSARLKGRDINLRLLKGGSWGLDVQGVRCAGRDGGARASGPRLGVSPAAGGCRSVVVLASGFLVSVF